MSVRVISVPSYTVDLNTVRLVVGSGANAAHDPEKHIVTKVSGDP